MASSYGATPMSQGAETQQSTTAGALLRERVEPSNGRWRLTLSYLSSTGFRLSFTPKVLAVDLNSVKVRTLIPFAVGSRLEVTSGAKVVIAKVLNCRCEKDGLYYVDLNTDGSTSALSSP